MWDSLIYLVFAGLFGLWEGIMYYDPFKAKFWSRAYYQREKKTFLDKYFPIDGPHLTKQAIILLLAAMIEFYKERSICAHLFYWLFNYALVSLPFNGVLYLLSKKANERQNP